MALGEEEKKRGKEGKDLLGSPTFTELENGRLKCVETGHEMLAKDKDSYSQSKRCRLGLIDFALSHSRPPLNMFKQDPLSRAKVICKLTGDTVNKTEEHIWKHINGKRFLNKLEQKETEKLNKAEVEVESKSSANGLNKKKKKKVKEVEEIIYKVRESEDKESDSEEADFWMPPVGDRWDLDDGGDRWGSGSESEEESYEENSTVENGNKESEELSARTKRMSIEIGPSSFASRKKKSRKKNT
ncbi:Surfeit locus 2 [Melia azedarach]|uniref:Surfeit locus 2 n=1 Tax=Melia azedarach TaxID=155640 RepID=A0ACC1Z0N6_MELAZ|nr:Surfeit locus 2 [Melia azedarach]